MIIDNLISRYTFSLIVAVGIGIGLYKSLHSWPTIKTGTSQQGLKTSTLVLTAAVIGGRFAYVAVNWQHFLKYLPEIPAIWLGGISWIGALSGALVGIFIAARFQNTSFSLLADHLLPLFSSIIFSAWLGSWLVGAAYGPKIDSWLVLPSPDAWGSVTRRFPVALTGISSALLLRILVERLRIRQKLPLPGFAACIELSGFSLTMLALSRFREDPAITVSGIRLDAWGAILLIIFLAAWTFWLFHINHSSNKAIRKLENHEN